MHKEIETYEDWNQRFKEIIESADKMSSILNALGKWVWDNVVAKDVIPPEMPYEVSDALARLAQEIRSIKKTCGDVHWYFCSQPLDRFLAGETMSREEFYLLAAMGVVIIPSKTGKEEAYEEFKHYLYQDAEKKGYINPREKPDLPPSDLNGQGTLEIHLTIGITPEDVKVQFLKKEQRDYFESFRPDLFSRFSHGKGIKLI